MRKSKSSSSYHLLSTLQYTNILINAFSILADMQSSINIILPILFLRKQIQRIQTI